MSNYSKNWWRPLWSGLAIDPDGKHSKQMKTSVWLFLYLILVADQKTGMLTKSYAEISRMTGRRKKTTLKWMNALRRKGYVLTKKEGKRLVIQVKKWKFLTKCPDWGTMKTESTPNGARNGPQLGRIEEEQKSEKSLCLSQKIKKGRFADRYNVNKDIYNIVNVSKPISFDDFSPKTKEELLALDLAQGLNDLKSLNFYLSVSKKYPEELLRRICNQVREIPTEKIKKSKGALFTYLLKNTVRE